jgi:hypothetical protein
MLRELRSRHPGLREALAADARVTALYRSERHELRGRTDVLEHLPAVQYLLALHPYRLIWELAAALVIEVSAIVAIGAELTEVAMAMLAVQAACAGIVLTVALGRRSAPSAVPAAPVTG